MSKTRKRLLCGGAVLSFFLILSQELFAFSVEPARIELNIPAGRQRGKAVTVDNTQSDEPLHLKVYMTDVIFLPDGTNDFPDAGTTEWSCASWVKVVPEEIDVPAGRSVNVRVNVSVPEGVKGGYYGMLFFESSSTASQGLSFNFRLGGLLDVSVTNTEERKASISNIALNNPKQIEVDIYNSGNILLRPKGKIKIFDARGKRIKQVDFNPQGWGVLPKSTRKFYAEPDKALAPGDYKLKFEIDYGTKYLLGAELPVNVN
jgi:P pilus assembly chaperone PapD